ncbi:lipopolysaccharide kinase InaA family protein [Thauera butanivorans]|mgnify:CR=1 FL=1|uniref:lipopolysaccharide kinase InaA family protein n=1 Tax=Thauera butanivorans TaxID=86174 RepID=UPI003AB325DD
MSDSAIDYPTLRGDAEIIEADGHGEKVLRLADGSYLKVFRRKRLLSSAAWYPYARRFADNAEALARLGIPCPHVIRVHRFPIIRRDVVHYRPLPGLTLRQIIQGAQPEIDTRALLGQLGRFVATLHDAGVFFRSIHLGNIVLGDDGRLGLIDIADMQAGRRPLPRFKRKRNFAHLLRYREDRAWLMADGGQAFAEGYAAQAGKGYAVGDLQAWLNATAGAGR